MQAGTLDHLFTLERPNDTSTPVSHTPIAKVWGSLSGLSGIESPAIQARADYRISIRYRTDITPRDRLREGSRVFEIVSMVDLDGERQELQILASEQV